jgi:hypothetical protein
MRARVTVPVALTVLVIVALPMASHSQAPTIIRGAIRTSLPPEATVGTFRGALPPDATVGATRGALPSGSTVGAVHGATPPGGTVGVFRGTVLPGSVGVFRGDVPADASVGARPQPIPPGARFGEPGPDDIAASLTSQARILLLKGDYRPAEIMLKESVTIREQSVGPDRPEIVQALEDNAKLLRQWNRDAVATEMETRAGEIRTKLEEAARREAEPKATTPR